MTSCGCSRGSTFFLLVVDGVSIRVSSSTNDDEGRKSEEEKEQTTHPIASQALFLASSGDNGPSKLQSSSLYGLNSTLVSPTTSIPAAHLDSPVPLRNGVETARIGERRFPNEVLVETDELRVWEAEELAWVEMPIGEAGKAFSLPFFFEGRSECRTLSPLRRLVRRASTRPREAVFSHAGPKEAMGEEHMKQVISRGGLWAQPLMRALRQVWQRRSAKRVS